MADNVQGIEAGQTVTFTKPVTQQDIQDYGSASGDTNPLHFDAEYAKKTRFGTPIAHGMLSAGVISAAIGTKLAPHAVCIYLSQNLRFRAPVAQVRLKEALAVIADAADRNGGRLPATVDLRFADQVVVRWSRSEREP